MRPLQLNKAETADEAGVLDLAGCFHVQRHAALAAALTRLVQKTFAELADVQSPSNTLAVA